MSNRTTERRNFIMAFRDLRPSAPVAIGCITSVMIFRRSYFPARRSRRQWLNTSVEVFCGPTHMHALGVNVSEGGMCFFAVANLPVGSQLDVQFRPAHAEEHVRFRGTVRHRALYLYGIEFMADAELTSTSDRKLPSSVKTRHQSWAS